MDTDFKMMALGDQNSGCCALVFLAPTTEEADSFLVSLVETAYAPRGEGDSQVILETRDPGILTLSADSAERSVSLSVSGVSPDVATAIRHSLDSVGVFLILFGASHGDGFRLLTPSENHLVRREILIDGSRVLGTHYVGSKVRPFVASLDEATF